MKEFKKSYVEDTPLSMDDLLNNNEISREFVLGTIVHGTIAEKRNDGALVDIGYKAEGFVPATEFKSWEEAKVGDELDVYLEELENDQNTPSLSLAKANRTKSW